MHLLDDLAVLSFDSSSERVRGWRSEAEGPRVLVFASPPLELELEVLAGHVVGQIMPPGPGEIVIETAGGATYRAEADDAGFFDLHGVPPGPVRLRCQAAAGQLNTDWICL